MSPKILFIAYYFSPFPGVGAKRLTYWAESIDQYGYAPVVITAIKQNKKRNFPVYFVKNRKSKRILSYFIKDEGYSWELDLIDFLKEFNLKEFKYVVISGGPFMHFKIAKQIKQINKHITVIYDYRDPFAINPRFNDGIIKKNIKKWLEKKLNKYADFIVTVNEFCAKLIQSKQEVKIIENGYDERILDEINKEEIIEIDNKGCNKLIHTGSLYEDRDPTVFLNVLSSQNEFEFYHFGNDSDLIKPFKQTDCFHYGGLVSYKEALKQIKSSYAGVIFTTGAAFESTTKIFDYLALNIRILIITEGEKETGNLHEISKDYPNVVWSKNEKQEIKTALKKLSNLPLKQFDAKQFSRKVSLEKFVQLLSEK